MAASGTGGSITDRAPVYPIVLIGTFLLGFGAMIFDFTTAGVRDDPAGWGALRLLGSLGLGLGAGGCSYAGVRGEIPNWWLLIILLLSVGVLCVPAGVARLSRRHQNKRAS